MLPTVYHLAIVDLSQLMAVFDDHLSRTSLAVVRLSSHVGWSSVLRPRQHSIGYMGDGFYRSKDPTNSIKVLKEIYKGKIRQHKQQNTHTPVCIDNNRQKRIHTAQQVP